MTMLAHLTGVSVLLLLALVSVCLASIEAAFYQMKRRRLGYVAFSNPRAELTNKYIEDPPRLLMPVHIGTYTAHVGMTGILILLFMGILGRWAVGASLLIMIGYLLAFRLTAPYAIARRNPERVLLFLVPLVDRYCRLMAPIVSLLRRSIEPIEAASASTAEASASSVNESDGQQSPRAREAIELQLQDAVERFTTLLVRNVMTPRPDIVAIPEVTTIEKAKRIVAETKLSRLPVFRDNLDDVMGVITARDLVECTDEGRESVAALTRPMHVVPETKKLLDLLQELQSLQATIALVVDEYGGVAGLISMEDIVEELVGDIKDEYDLEGEPIIAEPDGAWLVSGRVSVSRIEQALESSLGEAHDVETIGGLVAKVFGRIPRSGESTEYMGLTLEVVDAVTRRVNRVRLRRNAPVETE